jgi:rubrerythrin
MDISMEEKREMAQRIERMKPRIEAHQNWVCPDCGSKLIGVRAKSLLESHHESDRARKCPSCEYWAVGEDDWGFYKNNDKNA